MRKPLLTLFAASLFFTPAFVSSAFAQKTPIRITADLSEAPRKLYHAEIDLPVKPGEHASFLTPQWIPGNHAPNGPASQIVGVVFYANGQPIPWRRDDVNLYEFHVDVPAGVTSLHVHLDSIVPGRVTREMAVLEWERLMLYPAHIPVKDIAIQPSVTVPAGWGIGTALVPQGTPATPPPTTGILEDDHHPTPGATTQAYAVTTVEQLQDSPVLTGKYFHEFTLAPRSPPSTSSTSSVTFPKTPTSAPSSSLKFPTSSAKPAPPTPPTTTTATTFSSPFPTSPAAKASSTSSPPTTASAKRASPMKSTNSPKPTSSPTSSPTPGTANTAAPKSSTSPTSPHPSRASFFGSTKA